ncbi:MAG: glycosyltransferase family 2 protein [Planctomycetota bacterium]|nr:glycosyltransferase family 2 protein [Planctomycetota bacterium]
MPEPATIQILMAVYNGQRFIAEQLRSILAQTYPHFQVTIRDNTSTDQTLEVVREFVAKEPSRIRLLDGDGQNVGAMGNFARLLDHVEIGQAQPNYVMFADADDVWLPDKVERTFAEMRRLEGQFGREKPLLVHTDLRVVDAELNTIADSFWRFQFLDPSLSRRFNRALVQNVVTGCTTMLNGPLVALARPIPPETIMHDWWIALVAAGLGEVGWVDAPTMLYRQHGRNDTGARRWGRKLVTAKAMSLLQDRSLREAVYRTCRQAGAFSRRYGDQLSPERRQLVAEFASIPERGFVGRRALILRRGFFKIGVMRNLGMLAAV